MTCRGAAATSNRLVKGIIAKIIYMKVFNCETMGMTIE